MNEVFSLVRTKIIIDLENLHSITTLGNKRKMLEYVMKMLILSCKIRILEPHLNQEAGPL